MPVRRYLGPVLGLVMALALAASVAANTIGPNRVSSAGVDWNSEIFTKTSNGTVSYAIQYCSRSTSTYLTFDLMHHWFLLPSTGTQTVSYTCQNNSSWWNWTWSNVASADYSIEYNGPTFCTKFSCSDTHASWTYRITY
jgi:hypothetical protein